MTAVLHGDCLAILPTLPPDSFDSCVTDPPYHLLSIVKRFGNAAPERELFAANNPTEAYGRMSRGFMGKQWDGGDVAARPETWAAVYRVLKPGAHLVAFGGSRTYHRMACAIEDAGFEIRDCIQWIYGSGFPKSHDVSKGIDRAAGAEREVVGERDWSNAKMVAGQGISGLKQAGSYAGDYESERVDVPITAPATDAARQWQGWGTALKPACEPIVLARKPLSESTVAANVLKHGTGAINIDGCRIPTGQTWENEQSLCVSCAERVARNTKQSAQETRESIATNNAAPTTSERASRNHVATDKTDIGCSDGMRAESISTSLNTEEFGKKQTDQSARATKFTTSTETNQTTDLRICDVCGALTTNSNTLSIKRGNNGLQQAQQGRANIGAKGRWPSNICHDGSDEVVQGFPETTSGARNGPSSAGDDRIFKLHGGPCEGDTGSAARFFYTAKADGDERIGSKHPTVKPVDLMQWLVRLVTPKGGSVLDPFAGTGTTGEAAWREGCLATLIEREAEYLADIARRMELMKAGPDERAREIVKASGKAQGHEDLPLFDRAWADMWEKPFDKPELVWGKK